MNRYFIILALLLFACFSAQAQSNFHNIHYLDPYNPEYVKGEVLVKFKDEAEVKTAVKSGVALTGIESVDELLQVYQLEAVTKVFKETREQRQRKTVRTIRDFKGKEIEVPALFNIYKLKFDTAWDVKQIVEALQADKQIAFAEPNYLVYTAEVLESGLVPDQAPERPSLPDNKGTQNTFPNDPLYQDGSQWYLDAINAPAAWDSVTGDTSQIIAIIDTGVDWDHPDLDDNIWTNWNEIPNNGIDDDNNGYVDDTRGWDYINNDNDPNDDNSHGTHVAGIAAAEGNNGIGICGVAWNAKIMPVKMLQSSGTGNSSDLASAIEYASDNGATVINMSLGSYGESLTVKNVLYNAYVTSVLVAAAGNDALDLDKHCPLCNPPVLTASYPACYSFVLGVKASQQSIGDCGMRACFSNFDPSGPIIYGNKSRGYFHNYELMGPGVGIISTIPNGYRSYNGTSMAAPIISGICALSKSYNDTLYTDFLWSKMIFGSDNNDIVNAYNTLTLNLDSIGPDLRFIEYTLIDTLPGCDNDGRADANETIQLYFAVKNVGGYADSAWAKLRFSEFEDTTTAIITDSTSYIGDISTWATLTSALSPIEIKIDSNVTHNRDIVFEYEIGLANNGSTLNGEIVLNIEKGEELSGVMDSTLVLTNDKLWLINNSFRIGNYGILRIEAGTKVENNIKIVNRGNIIALGTYDSLIVFTGEAGFEGNGTFNFSWTTFKNKSDNFGSNSGQMPEGSYNFNFCQFIDINTGYDNLFKVNSLELKNCIINGCYSYYTPFPELPSSILSNFYIERNNIINSTFSSEIPWVYGIVLNKFGRFKNNNINNIYNVGGSYPNSFIAISQNITSEHHLNNLIGFSNNNNWFIISDGDVDRINFPNQYWGTSIKDIIEMSSVYDFWEDGSLPLIDISGYLTQPSNIAHGIVWKVELNGIDPQDEYLDPIGSETVKFDVYFNRPMDTLYHPLVGFGVFEPYLQRIVSDSAYWSSDSTIWTAYYTIGPETGDGINTIHVRNAKDPEGFEIPPEMYRFKFVIQAASAASIEFYANAGIGKVDLEWPPTPSDDALGYNLYRYYNLTDSTYSDTLMINTELILDTLFTDYNVIPDTTYHYLYKTLGTDMVETDYSKKVTATPFSAANGDANGDLTVNVLDITTIVSYILNQDPQPFLSDAADVNYDGQINLLDIIGVVNLIMNQKAVSDRPYPMISQQKAYYEWRGRELWLHSQGNVAGLQFDLALPENLEADQLRIKSRLPGFEMASQMQAANIQGLLFSLDGKTIPAGENCLLELIGAELPSELQFTSILGGELEGDLVEVLPYGIDDLPEQGTEQQMLQVQPNPFSHQLLISWDVPEASKVALHLYDQQGRLIKSLYEGQDVSGNIYWEGKDQHNKSVSKGVYILRMEMQQKEGLQSVERKIIFN